MAPAIPGIGRTLKETAPLELVEQADDVGGLDAKRQRQVPLRRRALRLEVMEEAELRPPQSALGETAAEAPRRGSRQSKDEEATSRAQRRVPDVRR
jgi:hypothetical protein